MNPTPHRADLTSSQALPAELRNPSLSFSVCSFTGVGHTINQDSHAFRDGRAYVVADGVGGGAWGEIASASLCSQLVLLDQVNERLVDLASRAWFGTRCRCRYGLMALRQCFPRVVGQLGG